MPRVLRHLFAILFVVLIAGCASGGCGSGCASCGVTPIPEGFDTKSRIENAASLRLTDSGVTFLQDNIGALAKTLLGGNSMGGILTFEVPQTTGSAGPITYTLCPNGADPNASPKICTAEIDVGNAALKITPTSPSDLMITGTIPIRVDDIQVKVGLGICNPQINIALDHDGSCPGGDFEAFPLKVDIAIHVDQDMTQTARYGYSVVDIKQVVDDNDAKSNLESSLQICNVPNCDVLCCLSDACSCALAAIGDFGPVKNLIVGALAPQITGTLTTQIDNQLCLKADAMANPTCPNGTTDVSGTCRFGADASSPCVSTLLGTDGHLNLGQLLAKLSPGTKGGLDFVLAAGGPDKRTDNSGNFWGDLNPINNGATLGMYGGAEPSPLSGCVPFSKLALPMDIPIPDLLTENTVPNWPAGIPGPHVGIALSERYANYALSGVYNSGLLCIGITTESFALLNSGTLGLLASSMKDLGLQREAQQVALVVRPQQPPTVTFGNGTDIDKDPVMRVKMNQASFDFYIWSLDRFIRFMTTTFDLDIPVNLTVTKDGIAPVIDKIGVANPKVTNNALLKEDPDGVGMALASLIASTVGQAVGGGIKPINLNSSLASLGLSLIIPDSVAGKGSPGLQKVTQGSDNYLGIFASLAIAMPIMKESDTGGEAIKKFVDPTGLKLATMSSDNAPIVTLKMSSSLDGPEAVEFAYRVDQGFWHPWTRERIVDIQDDWLRVQGHHTVSVRSRILGEPNSMDSTPATVDVIIDAEPPTIKVGAVEAGNLVALDVTDRVSKADGVQARVRIDGGSWSDWMPASQVSHVVVGEGGSIEVEAKDEEGNIGSTEEPLIRGRDTAAAASGCGCSIPGESGTTGRGLWLLGAALLGVAARLRKTRKTRVARRARRFDPRGLLGGVVLMAAAGSMAGCSCGSDSSNGVAGGYTCTAPACAPLNPGLVGSYTSVGLSGTDVWFSGYAEADWDNKFPWGDLVVGKWNGKAVDWVAIDGVPSDTPADGTQFDLNGFRHGQTSPGPDVGLWTSLAIDAAGHPNVAYYDRTNKALKLAQFDGTNWAIATVQQKANSDIGKYAKLLLVNNNPVIAYLAIEATANNGVKSAVRVATATSATPGASGWAFEDVAGNDKSPCRAQFCTSDAQCVTATLACTPTVTGCKPDCASGTACVAGMPSPTCAAVYDKTRIDTYPDAIGDYITTSLDGKGGFGIAYYDRTNGNLVIASKAGGQWKNTIVDGADGKGNDTGDMGIGASLTIDDHGDWHISYVDGLNEQVRYVKVTGGTTVGTPLVVDDGLGIGSNKFPDGQHIVGDDSHIVVTPAGEIHITYQDATTGVLHYAVGTAAVGGKVNWTVKEIDHDGFGGAFSNQIEVSGALQLVEWWRVGGTSVHGDVDLVNP